MQISQSLRNGSTLVGMLTGNEYTWEDTCVQVIKMLKKGKFNGREQDK